jgi:hypothetical protein
MAGLKEPLTGAGTVKIGPIMDENNGKTVLSAQTIANADIKISKNNGDFAARVDTDPADLDEDGWYDVPLASDDTGTAGHVIVKIHVTGFLPIWRKFAVEGGGPPP